MIVPCKKCKGKGYTGRKTNWKQCPRCLGVGELSDDCSRGHTHCVEVTPPGQDTQVLCIDCQKNLGRKCEVFSRVVGYLSPIADWNEGKREEFVNRKTYKLEEQC